MKKVEIDLENGYSVILTEEQVNDFMQDFKTSKKEMDAITSEYYKLRKKLRICNQKINSTCIEYNIPRSSITNAIFNLFDDYIRLKEEELLKNK